jgi:hypothetical protein
MNDGPYKVHTGYLVEGLELLIHKVAYTKYDATVFIRWSNSRETNILSISLRCNNLFTLMCIRSYLAQHVPATTIIRCYTLVLSLNYHAVMLYFILSLIMRMLYLSKIVNIK